MLDMILAGLSEALQLANLLFVLLGVIAGMIAGAIPGVNGPMAIALCIPLSYYMSPVAAIGFLVGLNKGAFFGGSISGVLLNTPGTPESAATTWDGYPLAKQGKGEKALRMALYASVTGDAFATLVLILVAAPLAAVALYMGPPEIFALICMAMTIIAGLGTRSLLRGFIAAALGVLIGTVGIEPVSALPRLTFDIVPLERGISLIPVGIGMLAFSEIIIQLEHLFLQARGSLHHAEGIRGVPQDAHPVFHRRDRRGRAAGARRAGRLLFRLRSGREALKGARNLRQGQA